MNVAVKWSSLVLGISLLLSTWLVGQGGVIRTDKDGNKIIVFEDGRKVPFSVQGNHDDLTEKGSAENLYPVYGEEIDPGEQAYVPVTEEDLALIAERRAQLSRTASQIARLRADEYSFKRMELERTIKNTAPLDPEYQHLVRQLEAAQKLERASQREATQAAELALQDEIAANSGQHTQKYFEQKRLREEKAKQLVPTPGAIANAARFNMDIAEGYEGKITPLFRNSPLDEMPCQIVFEGMDASKRFYQRVLHKEVLFTHTDDRIRKFLKDKPYLTCEGYMTSVNGGGLFLVLELIFAYDNAESAYGFIKEESPLTIKLLNGQFVNLFASKADAGRLNPNDKTMTYTVQYPIDRSYVSLLKKVEMEKMVIFWSSGYEEYEVYHLDFFMQQLSCLEK